MCEPEHVWITGIGLISSLGEGIEEHWLKLRDRRTCVPRIEEQQFAPYTVHPLVALDVQRQIPRTSDQRQMERWQRIGVYAAGLALADAELAGSQELLARTDVSVAAGNGERDAAADAHVLTAFTPQQPSGPTLNRELMTGLRPTLYLGQLSNLLAGNISIVHGVTGSSRTFKGEEMAGVSALENAVERIQNSESELVLVGGALNAEREDLLLGCELEQVLYRSAFEPVWERRGEGGGAVLGSVGVFLLLEAASHARLRGRKPYARIKAIQSDRSRRQAGDAAATMARLFASLGPKPRQERLPVLSGASGAEPVTADEQAFIAHLGESGLSPVVRAWGSLLGHSREAHFLVGVALAAISVVHGAFYPPFASSAIETSAEALPDPILVTTLGSWRGEAVGLLSPAL